MLLLVGRPRRAASSLRSARRGPACRCSSRSSRSGCCSARTGRAGSSSTTPSSHAEVGMVGLALILYEGGLQTSWRRLRQVAVPAALLSTVGVVVSALLTGVAAYCALRPLLARVGPARRRRRRPPTRPRSSRRSASRTSAARWLARSRRSRAATTRRHRAHARPDRLDRAARTTYGFDDLSLLVVEQIGLGLVVGVALGALRLGLRPAPPLDRRLRAGRLAGGRRRSRSAPPT